MSAQFTPRTFGIWAVTACSLLVSPLLATNHQVSVTSNTFSPSQLNISLGDTVTWTNTEGHHNVNGTQATFPSNPASFGNNVGSGWTFSHAFTLAGTYDYQCDPHAGLGMTGRIVVTGPLVLTINFTGMDPHAGQDFMLRVTDRDTDEELARVRRLVEPAFSISIEGIEIGRRYRVSFFADHNGNGQYDPPPADHAWKIDTEEIEGSTTLDFAHSTDFENIEWEYRLKLQLTGMNPHLGQLFIFYLFDTTHEIYVDTVTVASIANAAFDIESEAIIPGHGYHLDFYADLNGTGAYEAPPADHAWRIILAEAEGDTTMSFSHSTNFTDIFSAATGTPGYNAPNALRVFPNPARNLIVVSGSPEQDGKATVEVYNASGQQLNAGIPVWNADRFTLDVSALPTGTFHMRVRAGDTTLTGRFVKVR